MKSFLGTEETPPAAERSIKNVTKSNSKLLTNAKTESASHKKLSCYAKDICVKRQETSQNTKN